MGLLANKMQVVQQETVPSFLEISLFSAQTPAPPSLRQGSPVTAGASSVQEAPGQTATVVLWAQQAVLITASQEPPLDSVLLS